MIKKYSGIFAMRFFALIGLIFITTNVFAMICPTNFSFIDYGATVDQVISQCGKPNELKEFTSNGEVAQQWSYFVKPNGFENLTVKLNVLLVNNEVTNITIDDENQAGNSQCTGTGTSTLFQANCTKQPERLSVASTPLCGFPIKIGDTAQTIQATCGKPALVEQVQANNPDNHSSLKMINMLYAGPPRVILIFEDGKLKDRQFL